MSGKRVRAPGAREGWVSNYVRTAAHHLHITRGWTVHPDRGVRKARYLVNPVGETGYVRYGHRVMTI